MFFLGVIVGIWSAIIIGCVSWAVGFYIDKLLWNRVRAAEKTIDPHSAAIIHLVRP